MGLGGKCLRSGGHLKSLQYKMIMVNDMVCTSMKVGEIAEWQTVRFSEPKINKFNNIEKRR